MADAIHNPACLACAERASGAACGMSAEALAALEAIAQRSRFEKGQLLFAEGHTARGVYLLCEGRARLMICSEGDKRVMLRIASPGEWLGVGAALSNGIHELSAEILESSVVAFIPSKALTKFLREHRDVCASVVEILSQNLHAAYQRVRSTGLVRTRRPRPSAPKDEAN